MVAEHIGRHITDEEQELLFRILAAEGVTSYIRYPEREGRQS